MKTIRNIPTLIGLLTAWCATSAFGEISLNSIPLYGSDTSNEGRAITYDGQYVVGLSGTGLGFFYNVASGNVYNPIGGGAQATLLTGVGYRTNSGQLEVVLSGITSSGYGNWMTTDGGVTWGAKRRDTSLGTSPWKVPSVNGLAGTASDVFYSGFCDSASSVNWRIGQMSGAWPMTPSWANKSVSQNQGGQMWGISSTGRSVGTRKNTSGGPNLNYYYDWVPGGGTPTGGALNGLDGTSKGIAFCVNADGNTIYGHSPTVSDQVNNHGYKLVNPLSSPTVTPLPEFSDTVGSSSREIPYGCTPDGKYAVGMSYRGRETAVLWDTSSSDPAVWTVNDLYGLVAANADTNIFTRLMRGYSVATNAAGDLVVTGIGYDSVAAATRAFLLSVPKWIAAVGFPGNQTVNYGANVTFNVVTNGTDLLTFQWYKNGTVMPGATTTSINFNNVSCAGGEAGDYNCVVSNATISAVVTGYVAKLTVNDPFISSQPSSRTNLVNTTATFTVSGGGAPTTSFKWQRYDGSTWQDLTDGDTGWGSTIAGSGTTTLTISSVTASDANYSYRVVLTTSAGGCTANSRTLTLKVVERPVLTSITPSAGSYTLDISGPVGQTYIVRYTTNCSLPLSSWIPLVTNTFSGWDSFTDTPISDKQRFYILDSPYVITSP